MTEVLLPKFRGLGGAARGVERLVLVAVTVAGAFWALGLQHHLPVALFNEQYLGPLPGAGPGRRVHRGEGASGRAARSRALVRLDGGGGRTRRRTLHRRPVSVDLVLAGQPDLGSARAGRGRDRAGPRGDAPDRGLGPHVDRAGLHPLREVRLAPAGTALREGLELGPDRRLPLPRLQRCPRHPPRRHGQHRGRLHLLRPGPDRRARRRLPHRLRDGVDGPLPRRVREDGRRVVEPLRHRVGQRGGQRRRRRRRHHPDDEALGLSAPSRGRHRGGVVERRPDHAARSWARRPSSSRSTCRSPTARSPSPPRCPPPSTTWPCSSRSISRRPSWGSPVCRAPTCRGCATSCAAAGCSWSRSACCSTR